MRVLVVGKAGNVTFWMENVVAAFRRAGYVTGAFSTAGQGPLGRLTLSVVKRLKHHAIPDLIAHQFRRTLAAFRPDLMVFTHAFWGVPLAVYEAAHEHGPRPPMIGWVGDVFTPDQAAKARLMDRVLFTDSGFIEDAQAYRFPQTLGYLPLAVDPRLFRPGAGGRENALVLVANRTPHRQTVVDALHAPLALYGRGWTDSGTAGQRLHPHLIGIQRTARLYRRFRGALNIINEQNVRSGLNQRNFEPLAAGAALLTERSRDLERCFDPGREVLAYADAEELNELAGRLLRDAAFAQGIAVNGRQRVLAEHTYAHRIEAILSLVS